jgi:hypothetical protein|tara:strand:+ start:13118 stop:13297 length:180 start_codon:yes stop_codon:yes gene_type:complete
MVDSATTLLETIEGVIDGLTQLDGRYLINYTSARENIRHSVVEIKKVKEKLEEDISLAE